MTTFVVRKKNYVLCHRQFRHNLKDISDILHSMRDELLAFGILID